MKKVKETVAATISESKEPSRRDFIYAVRRALNGDDGSSEIGEALRELKQLSDTMTSPDPMFKAKLMGALVACLEYGHTCGRRAFIERLHQKNKDVEKLTKKYRITRQQLLEERKLNERPVSHC